MSWMFSLLCNYWLLVNFDILYFSTDGCINKLLTTYLLKSHPVQLSLAIPLWVSENEY